MDAMREEKKKREQKMKMNRYYNFFIFYFFKMGICKYANLNGAFSCFKVFLVCKINFF